MSYKIFNAYRVPSDLSIGRINEVSNNIKDLLKPHIENHLRQNILNKVITLYFSSLKSSLIQEASIEPRSNNWKKEIGEAIGISELVYDALIIDPEYNSEGFINPEKCIKLIKLNLLFLVDCSNKSELKKDNNLTSEVNLEFFSRKRNTYFRIFSPLNGDIQEYLGSAYQRYDYRYYNYCDKPKEYSEDEWSERYEAWNEIYFSGECNKFTTTLFDAPSIAQSEGIFENLQNQKEEVLYLYKTKRDISVFSYYIDKKLREAKSTSSTEVIIGTNTYHVDDFKNKSTYFDVISDINIYKKNHSGSFDNYVKEFTNKILTPEEFFAKIIKF